MIKKEFEEPILITVTNQKGGVGKTTVTINLAEQLALRRFNTLIIDTDPQGNVSDRLLEDSEVENTLSNILEEEKAQISKSVCITQYSNLAVIPSGKEALSDVIAKANRKCTGLRQFTNAFKRIVKDLNNDIDFILFDTPPDQRSLLLRAAYAISDYTLLVIEPEIASLLGILQNHAVFTEEQKYNPKLKLLGTVLNMVDHTTCSELIQKQVKELKENILPFQAVIRRKTKIREAQMAKRCIADYAKPHSHDFKRLCDEMLNRISAKSKAAHKSNVVSLQQRA